MRPSSVDTSEPACTNRKMLSTKSSTSWSFTSRKYSAIVRAEQRDAQAHARRLVHLAEHQRRLVEHARLRHLDAEVGALTGALAHAGEHRHAAVVLGDPADHLGDEHGLAHAGAAEQADLAAGQVGRQQVDDLDAGLEHLLAGLELAKAGASRWMSQCSSLANSAVGVEGLAPRRSRCGRAPCRRPALSPWPVLRTGGAAGEAVGRPAGRWPVPGCRRAAGPPRPAP